MVEPGTEREQQYHDLLEYSLQAGATVLEAGGSSEEAVVAAVGLMEDSPLFNCGHGSSVTMKGTVEMDAAIMSSDTDGRTRAGAVSSATKVRNPIKAAQKVLEDERFVLLTADGADDFAAEAGLVMETSPDYFIADWRWDLHIEHMPDSLEEEKRQQQLWRTQRKAVAESASGPGAKSAVGTPYTGDAPRPLAVPELKFGTVGCVALDRSGRLCAGTSTGGLNNKQFRRVGDSPLIGAGTYADRHCAVSCTGAGENFIKEVVAHSVAGMMKWAGATLADACDDVIYGKPATVGGVSGGLVAMDATGTAVYPFNSKAMYRGKVDSTDGGKCTTLIWREESDPNHELHEQPIH